MIQMPKGAKILSVGMQEGIPCLFAAVNDQLPHEPRIIRVVTTGDVFGFLGLTFIGTIFAGEPTWFTAHVFEQHTKADDLRDSRFAADFKDIAAEVQEKVASQYDENHVGVELSA